MGMSQRLHALRRLVHRTIVWTNVQFAVAVSEASLTALGLARFPGRSPVEKS